MDNCFKISFKEQPVIWLKDKIKTIIDQPKIYIASAIPNIFIIFGVIANIVALWVISNDSLMTLLLIFLFFYGIINLFLVYISQRRAIQLSRTQGHFSL